MKSELFDPIDDRWKVIENVTNTANPNALPTPMRSSTITDVHGKSYILGGTICNTISNGASCIQTDKVFEYQSGIGSLEEGAWTESMTNMLVPRSL